MKIAQIKQLDVGISGLKCSGSVGFVGNAKNVKGEYNGKPYDFWTQFVVIEDNGDSIGVNLRLDAENQAITRSDKGNLITIEKAELRDYNDKKGKKQLSLSGLLSRPQQAQQTQQGPSQAPQSSNNETGMRSIRTEVFRAVMSATDIPQDQIEIYLQGGVQWIIAGEWKLTSFGPAKTYDESEGNQSDTDDPQRDWEDPDGPPF